MKNHSTLKLLILIILIFLISPPGKSQSDMPDVMKQGKLTDQLNFIEERTRIYEYYRAIREDMFQQIKRNTLDTLSAFNSEITELTMAKTSLDRKIDSLNIIVSDARAKLDEAVKTKNNIRVLGMNVNKFVYNSIMWIILIGLTALLTLGFLIFKRNLIVTRNTRKDLEDLKAEFEAYRKQSREAREKMSMEHFNALRKLRAKGEGQRAEGTERRAQGEEQRAKGTERRAEGEEQRAESEEQRAQGTELRAQGEEQRAESEEQGSESREQEVKGEGQENVNENQKNEIPEANSTEGITAGIVKKPRKRKPRKPDQNDNGVLYLKD